MDDGILIYVPAVNARIHYTFGFVFGILGVPYRFTTKLEEFVAYNGPKFSYTQSRLSSEFHVHASGLLQEKGLHRHRIVTKKWEGLTVIFPSETEASLPFDIFSGIFYLISRYEEYVNDAGDEHGRFGYQQSLAYREGFLEQPLVDLWLDRFKKVFEAQHPGFRFPEPHFYFRPLLSVSISHLFKHKGLIRQLGGVVENLFLFQFKNVSQRILYAFTRKRDPYDTFYKIIALKKQYEHPLLSFFLIGPFTDFDHNVSLNRPAFRKVIKTMSDYSEVGLMISYYKALDEETIKSRRLQLERLIHKPVDKTHFHYYRHRVPQSYRLLSKLEFSEDYSCGYPKHIGYRASTAHPFYFYDLEEEEPTELLVFPVVVTDYHLNFIHRLSPEQALEKLLEIGRQTRKTGGHFQPLFHNSVLSEYEDWKNWSNVYIKVLENYAT